jgi:hypothetical protein
MITGRLGERGIGLGAGPAAVKGIRQGSSESF